MALENRLNLKLSQRLILTPQLQQAIKLLQMPQIELIQALNQELIENPFLEEAHDTEEADGYREEDEAASSVRDDTELPLEDIVNFSVDEYFEERSSDGRDLGYFASDAKEQPSYEIFYAKKPDLYDHLLWQLRLSSAPDELRKIAEAVIGNIDEDGYLRATEEEMAASLNVNVDKILAAISLVQSFDPSGVGARDLKECLLLQINALNLGKTLIEKIVANNIDYLQKKRYYHIAKQYSSPIDDIMTAVRIIESLEPRPGRSFFSGEINYISPDVFINKTDGEYEITLNDDGMPNLRLNQSYRKLLLKKEELAKEEREFLKEKLRLAIELIKSLSQRNRTIYRAAESILKFQRDFFDKGVSYLKPLNLKDVATDIGMHESTISRVTSNKFLSCNHGIFSFRYFFGSALQSGNGEVSSASVKDMIKNIVAKENPKKPMSDQMITDRLKTYNINIARRTVAKYREDLKMPPQNMRKKYE